LQNASGNGSDQYGANIRTVGLPSISEFKNDPMSMGTAIQTDKMEICRGEESRAASVFHPAVKPNRKENAQRCPVTRKSGHPGKMECRLEFKGKKKQ